MSRPVIWSALLCVFTWISHFVLQMLKSSTSSVTLVGYIPFVLIFFTLIFYYFVCFVTYFGCSRSCLGTFVFVAFYSLWYTSSYPRL